MTRRLRFTLKIKEKPAVVKSVEKTKCNLFHVGGEAAEHCALTVCDVTEGQPYNWSFLLS